jgi:hypothetical protein
MTAIFAYTRFNASPVIELTAKEKKFEPPTVSKAKPAEDQAVAGVFIHLPARVQAQAPSLGERFGKTQRVYMRHCVIHGGDALQPVDTQRAPRSRIRNAETVLVILEPVGEVKRGRREEEAEKPWMTGKI